MPIFQMEIVEEVVAESWCKRSEGKSFLEDIYSQVDVICSDKVPATPKGIPGRSPTPVLPGPRVS